MPAAPSLARVAPRLRLERLARLLPSACLLLGCERSLSDAECEALLGHYTAELARQEAPHLSAAVIARKQKLAVDLARRSPVYEFDACADKVSRRQFRCALASHSVDEIERCLL